MSEEFLAKRRKDQDDLAEQLHDSVVKALPEGDWSEVLDLFSSLFHERIVGEFATTDEPPADVVDVVTEALNKATPESDPDTISLMLAVVLINAAEAQKAIKFGGQLKWVTMHDRKVRDTHEEADGQVRDVGKTFTVGGVQMPFPGWPGAPIELWINCRCSLLAVPATETKSQISLNSKTVWHGSSQTWPDLGVKMSDTEDTTREPGAPWHGVLTVEGARSGDGRMFKEGSLRTRELPLPLTWQKVSGQGHDGNVTVGIIHEIARVGGEIRARGEWLKTPEAGEASDLVDSFGKYWVSIDADDIDQESLSIELDDDGREMLTFSDARTAASCMVSIPAFQEAFIMNGEMPDDYFAQGEALTASGGWAAPSEWFQHPEKIKKAFNITDEGHTFGYIAEWGVCHIGYPNACIEAPSSNINYSMFLVGEIETSDGEVVSVGALTFDTGHAAANLNARAAASHYDNTGTQWAYVTCGEDDRGIWFSGMVKPGTDEHTINVLKATGRTSGDWRDIAGNLELIAALTVNVEGFPKQKAEAMVASGKQVSLVAAGIAGDDLAPVAADPNIIAHLAAAIADEQEKRLKRRETMAALREKANANV